MIRQGILILICSPVLCIYWECPRNRGTTMGILPWYGAGCSTFQFVSRNPHTQALGDVFIHIVVQWIPNSYQHSPLLINLKGVSGKSSTIYVLRRIIFRSFLPFLFAVHSLCTWRTKQYLLFSFLFFFLPFFWKNRPASPFAF